MYVASKKYISSFKGGRNRKRGMYREALSSRAIEEKTYTPRKMLAANGIPVEVFVTE